MNTRETRASKNVPALFGNTDLFLFFDAEILWSCNRLMFRWFIYFNFFECSSHFWHCFDLLALFILGSSFFSFAKALVKVERALSSNRWGSSTAPDTVKLTGRVSPASCSRTPSRPSRRWYKPRGLCGLTSSTTRTLWENRAGFWEEEGLSFYRMLHNKSCVSLTGCYDTVKFFHP